MDHNHSHHQDHDKHEGHSPEMFRDKFWYSLLLTVPTLLYSEMVQNWLHFSPPAGGADFAKYIPLVFGTVLFFYSATFFIKGAEFFWELSTLITIMILGHWVEMKSVSNAQSALKELAKLLPDLAELENGEKVKVSLLKVGDVVLVRPGAKVPADGEVVDGSSSVNESMITGESELVLKNSGNQVIAGTVNGNGSLKVKVTKIGEKTALAGIMRLVRDAQASRSRAQILADQAAFYLTIIAIVSSTLTLVVWLIAGKEVVFALERTVTVLVIACPHALGLAVPLVTAISTSLAARNGLLIKNRLALEAARNIDVVLFDKTGTLTKGEHGVVDIWSVKGYSEDYLLKIAAALEARSEHAIAQAVVAKAKEVGIGIETVQTFRAIPGQGVEATINGKQFFVGKTMNVPEELADQIQQAGQAGKTVVYVLEQNKVIGALATADVIRDQSQQAVEQLKNSGVRVAMLTGDSEAVAQYVADKLGITEYFAQVLPENKSEKVKELQRDGSRGAMVGDGVNDAPALAQADIGIAIGAGTDVAIESAGIILAKSDPRDIAKIVKLSKATYKKMVQNLVWATGYNVVAIPLAAGLFGIILPPAIGAVLMSVSTIIVAFNAQLLRKQEL